VSRVGVFVCHCGENIARNVKVQEVVESSRDIPGAVVTADYPYLCSAPGQQMVIDAIEEHDLDRVVVAACSPQLHEPTFRAAAAQAGLNPHLCEMANIREHCSWVHRDTEQASAKAYQTVVAAVERVKRSRPLDPIEVPVTKRALVGKDAAAPAWGFSNRYEMPNDFLRLAFIRDQSDNTPYEVVGNFVETDLSSPLAVKYVWDDPDVTRYDPILTTVVALSLALDLVEPLTQSNTKKEKIETALTFWLGKAANVNGSERRPGKVKDTSWLVARARGG